VISQKSEVGKIIWYVPGYDSHNSLGIRCEIIKTDESGIYIDEPIIGPINICSAFIKKQSAEDHLFSILYSQKQFYKPDLKEFRYFQDLLKLFHH
jgi:hypothetical protein